MANGWTQTAEPAAPGANSVTLVEGSSFCISERNGDVRAGTAQGVFFQDTRLVDEWSLTVDDDEVEMLAVLSEEPWRASFLGRARPRSGRSESTLLVRRDRFVGQGMREDVVLANVGNEPAAVRLRVTVDGDFADLFEVKDGRVREPGRQRVERAVHGDRLHLTRSYGNGHSRGFQLCCDTAAPTRDGLVVDAVVPPRSQWRTVLELLPVVNGEVLSARFPTDRPLDEAVPARQAREWRSGAPVIQTGDQGLVRTLERSRVDLGALRIVDPEDPDTSVVAAGAPWFMTLFGRDSLLTSYMALPLDQSLALGTLKTLARLQGATFDPMSEEEPGRILHEVRFGAQQWLGPGGRTVYYGTADATQLFVVLLGELRRWGLAAEDVDALLPHADRALEWMVEHGDRDGDGFVEYQRATDRGLVNQGWKDSWDGVTHADGTIAVPPIALCEVQAYTYAAFLARAHFAWEAGDQALQRHWSDRASALKAAFNEAFWLADRGWYALALDGRKRPVDALASNMGHCLWSGIVDEDKAAQVAERLLSPEMFSGWGVRTLATSMGAYNPMSYHNGSIWPHDNALVAAGLMRYGFVDEAQQVVEALLDAAEIFGGRLPELFCGFSRSEYAQPVPFPTSCSPQAWASAAPVHALRTLLRLDPWVPHGKVWLAPALPPRLLDLRLEHVPLAGSRITIDVAGGTVEGVEGLPPGLELVSEPRSAASGLDGSAWG